MLRIGYGEAKTDEGYLTASLVFAERDPSPVRDAKRVASTPRASFARLAPTRGEGEHGVRQSNPTGKSAPVGQTPVQPSAQKYSPFRRRANHWFNYARLTRTRGVRTSRTRGGMRWTRRLRLTSVA